MSSKIPDWLLALTAWIVLLFGGQLTLPVLAAHTNDPMVQCLIGLGLILVAYLLAYLLCRRGGSANLMGVGLLFLVSIPMLGAGLAGIAETP